MAGHHMSAPLSWFHNRTHPVVEPAHLWTYGWLANHAKSCQIIAKHDLSHWFHGRTPGVRTTVPVPQQDPSPCGTGPFVDQWLTWKWCQKLPNDYKTWFATLVPWLDTRCPHHCPRSTTGPIPLWNRPTCGPLADLTIMPKVAKWLQSMIWDIGSMAGHLVSAPLPRFHNRTHPVVEPAHLRTNGWLENGAKSCQMIIKHDLRYWFHGWTPGVRTTVPVPQQDPSRCGSDPLVDPWLTCKWCQKLPND